MIPGENPEYGTLCGTNMYAVGLGRKRFMIDACSADQEQFLYNVTKFMDENDCYFDKIFVSHAHFDHMDGAYDLI